VKFRERLFKGREALRVDQPKQSELKMQARIGFAAEFVVNFKQDAEKPGEVLFAKEFGLRREAGPLAGRRRDERGLRASHTGNQKIAKMANGFAAEMLQVLPVGDQAVNQAERAVRRLGANGFDKVIEHAFSHHAQQFAHLLVGDGVSAVGDRLFEKR
jgi:hypothetical protein